MNENKSNNSHLV